MPQAASETRPKKASSSGAARRSSSEEAEEDAPGAFQPPHGRGKLPQRDVHPKSAGRGARCTLAREAAAIQECARARSRSNCPWDLVCNQARAGAASAAPANASRGPQDCSGGVERARTAHAARSPARSTRLRPAGIHPAGTIQNHLGLEDLLFRFFALPEQKKDGRRLCGDKAGGSHLQRCKPARRGCWRRCSPQPRVRATVAPPAWRRC